MIRKYVDVICLNDKGGNIKPLFLIWDDQKSDGDLPQGFS